MALCQFDRPPHLLRLGRKSQDRSRLKRKFRKKPATVRAPPNSVTVTEIAGKPAFWGCPSNGCMSDNTDKTPDIQAGQRFRTNWFTDSLMDKPHPGQSRAPAGAALLARWCRHQVGGGGGEIRRGVTDAQRPFNGRCAWYTWPGHVGAWFCDGDETQSGLFSTSFD